jgi:hypothetical protein
MELPPSQMPHILPMCAVSSASALARILVCGHLALVFPDGGRNRGLRFLAPQRMETAATRPTALMVSCTR